MLQDLIPDELQYFQDSDWKQSVPGSQGSVPGQVSIWSWNFLQLFHQAGFYLTCSLIDKWV